MAHIVLMNPAMNIAPVVFLTTSVSSTVGDGETEEFAELIASRELLKESG